MKSGIRYKTETYVLCILLVMGVSGKGVVEMEICSPQEIAEKIVELCLEKGVSVNRMLSDCNLNKSVVDNLKRGSRASMPIMVALSGYFGVSIDSLMMKGKKDSGVPSREQVLAYTETGREEPEPKPATDGLSADEEELIQMFRQLPPKEQVRLLGRVETMLERYR